MRWTHALSWVLLGVICLGSHSPPPRNDVSAWLVFYQRGNLYGGRFALEVNDRTVAEPFQPRRWFELRVPPGEQTLRTVNLSPLDVGKTFRLEVEPGERVYLEGVVEYDFLVAALYLVKRSAEEAQATLPKLKRDETTLPFVDR